MTQLNIWEFYVLKENEERFKEVAEQFATLFAESTYYHGTHLVPEPVNGEYRTYLTIDIWKNKEAFAEFKAANLTCYQTIDDLVGEVTEKEVHKGWC
jgi:heme-degrading monooxygenase HmoA